VHGAAAGLGAAGALAAYFAWVFGTYGDSPLDWYRRWVSPFRETGRAVGIDPSQLWDLMAGNLFRLDRPFMVLVLVMLPVFAWWTSRSHDRLGMAVLALGLAFVAQTAVQSDYAPRKMLVLLPFALPIAVGGLARVGGWREWVAASRRRRWFAALWITGVAVATVVIIAPPNLSHWAFARRVLGAPLPADLSYRAGLAGALVTLGALIGTMGVLGLVAGWRRPRLARIAGAALVTAMLVPLVVLDVRYVFTDVRTTYRDAMIAAGPDVNGEVTAGGASYAMQLYNSSRPVLQGYVFGMTVPEYERAVVRYFAEGRATSMFAYADPGSTRWTDLGFRLVETYPIALPYGHVMGRFVYAGPRTGP